MVPDPIRVLYLRNERGGLGQILVEPYFHYYLYG